MRARRLSLWLLVAVCCCGSVEVRAGDGTPIERILEQGGPSCQVMTTLDYLVNLIGPRLTGSPADHRACEWARDRFREFGLANVVMEEAGEFQVGFQRGPWEGFLLEPEFLALEFGTPAWSAGTPGRVKGPARLAPEDPETAQAADYAGTWVLMERRATRRSRTDQQRDRAVQEFLRTAGVAGLVYPTRGKYVVTGGNPRITWDERPTTPRINLRQDQWQKVRDLLHQEQSVVLQFDIRNHFVPGPVKFYNVTADLVGSEFPDEYVIVGGHIDSWDGATGTTDNGLGTAITLEAARQLAASGVRPRRTIRFALWSGEEQGLLGSRAMIDKHPELLDRISAVLVFDGGPNVIRGIDSSEAMAADLEQAFAPVKDLHPDYPFAVRVRKGLPVGIGSDHDAYLGKGVPGFFWHQEGRADFRHGIHTQYDTFDLAIPEYLTHSVQVVALGSFGIANLDQLLSRENLRAGGGAASGRRRMGVYLDEVTVSGVVPDSIADEAGLQENDVFLRVDGQAVEDRSALMEAIQAGEPRKRVTIRRGAQELELELKWPEEKPAENPAETPAETPPARPAEQPAPKPKPIPL